MNSKQVGIADFDGTITDAEEEGKPYTAGYIKDLAGLTGLPVREVELKYQDVATEISANPQAFGWDFDGDIVAPSSVDPYLRMHPAARSILKTAQPELTDDFLQALFQMLYRYNYEKSAIVFRPGAQEALEALADKNFYIVTNSGTQAVQRKLNALWPDKPLTASWFSERVRGDARKYMVNHLFHLVPERLILPGLRRPVLLRRRNYFKVLDTIRQTHDVQWSNMAVVGDIFELDLSLVCELGGRFGLLANEFTPAYEVDFVSSHPRGHVLKDVSEIPAFFAG